MRNHEYYLKIVMEAVIKLDDKWKEFFEDYLGKMAESPAAVKYHHNFKGGLLRHIAEMLEFGMSLTAVANIDEISFIKVVLLHDFAKLKTYKFDDRGNVTYCALDYPVEFWTLNELAKYGLSLNHKEINALVMAEGGWSEYDGVEAGRLASLLHVCDMWSAKVIKPQLIVNCPDCGAEMTIRKGPRGEFYGCTTYPNCRGIRELNDAELKLKEHINNNFIINIEKKDE